MPQYVVDDAHSSFKSEIWLCLLHLGGEEANHMIKCFFHDIATQATIKKICNRSIFSRKKRRAWGKLLPQQKAIITADEKMQTSML